VKVIEDDTTLVHKALSGSDQAFTHIFERYAESLWTQACGQCENFDDAHDLVQETFVRAFNRLHMLREPHKLSAWLRAILRRLAINQYERRRARQSHLENRNTIDIPGSAAKPFVDPESALMSHEIGEQIERALNFLTEKSRQVFIAFHLEGHSLEEVARLHNLSVGAVKNRLFH
jgi:RNA polymerase sigma-70 factor (ECF subfamily)